ncbi:MBL fold metallo-hydrolase [Desulfocurvus sp. DL9XJH121]
MPRQRPCEPRLAWRLIDGAYETELAEGLPRGCDAGCNTYVLRTPECVLVVDPGADQERALALPALLASPGRRMPIVFLTHCHADHCSAAAALLDALGPAASLTCHDAATRALRGEDEDATGAGILGLPRPRAAQSMGLFAPAGAGVLRDMRTPGGGLRCLSIPISGRDAAQVYHTPGHSPDSLCLRVGGALFIGDAACERRPELPGRDAERQAATLRKLLWLLDHANIVSVYPGHGPGLARGQAAELFRSLLPSP